MRGPEIQAAAGVCWRFIPPAGFVNMQLQHMPKTIKLPLPPRLRLSPFSLTCPYCKAKRGQECEDNSNGEPSTHQERIQMAALADRMGDLRTRAEKRARRANGNRALSLPVGASAVL
jgi:hypothetical protein